MKNNEQQTRQPRQRSLHGRIASYVKTWQALGYPEGIPDEVPDALMNECLAPSYKAICIALLKNDHSLTTLGFAAPRSIYYDILKRIEIEGRK